MDEASVGFKRPPLSTRFQKGRSGNPRGRPKKSKRELPHDALLGQMVTIRDEGKERRVSAAEAFLLHLTKKGLEGCATSARASLATIEGARASRAARRHGLDPIIITARWFGLCFIVEDLGMAVRMNAESQARVSLKLKSWIVEEALARMRPGQLSIEQQRVVVVACRTPAEVRWPDWWAVRN